MAINKNNMQKLTSVQIKEKYPDEWVLIGNPKMDEDDFDVAEGIVLLHSKDKKEVCYLGRELVKEYKTFTIIFTGKPRTTRKLINVFNRANPWQPLFDSLGEFSADFMEDRNQPLGQQERDLEF